MSLLRVNLKSYPLHALSLEFYHDDDWAMLDAAHTVDGFLQRPDSTREVLTIQLWSPSRIVLANMASEVLRAAQALRPQFRLLFNTPTIPDVWVQKGVYERATVVVELGQQAERDTVVVKGWIARTQRQLERAGHPVPENGPPMKWPPPGLEIDAHVSRNGRNMMLQKIVLLFQNLLIAILFKSGKRMGQFEPDHYKHMVSSNADFRKFDDGLKMTLDCDPSTLKRIEQMLEEARARGKIKYGLHAQDEAMMTCIVPSATRDDHMHFVDGASGGYARAAAAMRA